MIDEINKNGFVVRGLQPTHWMLLPEPPTTE